MRLLLPFLFGICLFFACKDSPEPFNPDCTFDYTAPAYNLDTLFPYLDPCGVLTDYTMPERYGYYDACFNPLNNNQIAFVRHDYSTFPVTIELCTFDFCTGNLKVLTNVCFLSPDWGAADWIAFRGKDKQIWMIKPNGDSLTQMTFTNSNHASPQWDDKGEKILFYETFPQYFNHIVMNIEGQRLDTIVGLNTPAVNWDGFNIVTSNRPSSSTIYTNYIYLRNSVGDILKTLETIPVPPDNSLDSTVYSLDIYSNNDLIYWSFPRQINVTNFSGQRGLVAKLTNANWYGRVSVSGDGTKLIVERTDRKRPDQCVVEERFRLYLMEADGSGERRIVFPE
ncbi:MAG: hypothetical protein R3D58_03770 [Saprospiraceae bacterium]